MADVLKQFPLPALDANAEANAVRVGEAVTLLDRAGKKHIGTLKDFASEDGVVLYRAKGCEECHHSGYHGRIAVHELLRGSERITRLIIDRAPVRDIASAAMRDGMRTLRQDAIEKALLGETDLDQIRRISVH
ncbi:MAG: hypothetical protein ACPGUC_02805 [Gammaproteobacteria bacterium]